MNFLKWEDVNLNLSFPLYFSSLLPSNVGDISDYNLKEDERNLHCRTQLFSNSFIQSAMKDLNDLSIEDRNIPIIASFKRKLNSNVYSLSIYYYAGKMEEQIAHYMNIYMLKYHR